MQSLRTLLAGIVDFAGFFPPARLSMAAAAEAYMRARASEHEWMLGRFICPASKLDELSRAAAALMPGTFATSGYREHAGAGEPWRISALLDGADLDTDLERVDMFNRRHSNESGGLAEVDTVEVKISDTDDVDSLIESIPEEVFTYVEIPVGAEAPGGDCRGFVAALAGTGMAAKIRTGGITPSAIPSSADVAAFIRACARSDVQFKATAGLHHPIRSEHPLDTSPTAPRAMMHGFLNMFMAATLVRTCETDLATTIAILDERTPSAFRFTETAAAWRDQQAECGEIALVREGLALCFGSCSFDEPVAELKAMGLM